MGTSIVYFYGERREDDSNWQSFDRTKTFKPELSGIDLVVARKHMETAGADAWLAKARRAAKCAERA